LNNESSNLPAGESLLQRFESAFVIFFFSNYGHNDWLIVQFVQELLFSLQYRNVRVHGRLLSIAAEGGIVVS
jgi:hypothetical protein